MGESAAAAATAEAVKEGAVGAGTGATVGKIFGMRQAMKSGIGSGLVELKGGVLVAALVAVNAFGDVRDPRDRQADRRRAPRARQHGAGGYRSEMKAGALRGGFERHNTTLVAVATNARLSKVGATKLAEFAVLGMARTIYPVNTMFDGDMMFALSLGDAQADVNTLGVAAAEAVAQAVVRAVRSAAAMGAAARLRIDAGIPCGYSGQRGSTSNRQTMSISTVLYCETDFGSYWITLHIGRTIFRGEFRSVALHTYILNSQRLLSATRAVTFLLHVNWRKHV